MENKAQKYTAPNGFGPALAQYFTISFVETGECCR